MRSSSVVRRDISVQTYLGTIAEGIHLASALRLFLWQREELHPAPLCGAQSSTTRARAGSVDPRGRGGRSRAKRLIRDPAKVALATQWKRGGVGVALGMSSEGFPHGAEELYASSVVQGLHGVHWPAFLVAVVLGPHPPCSCPRLGHVCSGCLPALLCSRAHERYSGLLIKYGTDWEQKAIRFNMGGEGDEESRE